MKTLPSKGLLSEVLYSNSEDELFGINGIRDNELMFTELCKCEGLEDGLIPYGINIYELAHKCKEWARDNYYVNIMTYKKGAKYYVLENEFLNDENFEADTEHETIFKACEWIMEQTK